MKDYRDVINDLTLMLIQRNRQSPKEQLQDLLIKDASTEPLSESGLFRDEEYEQWMNDRDETFQCGLMSDKDYYMQELGEDITIPSGDWQ